MVINFKKILFLDKLKFNAINIETICIFKTTKSIIIRLIINKIFLFKKKKF